MKQPKSTTSRSGNKSKESGNSDSDDDDETSSTQSDDLVSKSTSDVPSETDEKIEIDKENGDDLSEDAMDGLDEAENSVPVNPLQETRRNGNKYGKRIFKHIFTLWYKYLT